MQTTPRHYPFRSGSVSVSAGRSQAMAWPVEVPAMSMTAAGRCTAGRPAAENAAAVAVVELRAAHAGGALARMPGSAS